MLGQKLGLLAFFVFSSLSAEVLEELIFEQQLEAQSRPFRDELAELSIQAAEAQPSSLLSGESPSFRREFFKSPLLLPVMRQLLRKHPLENSCVLTLLGVRKGQKM